MTITQYLMILGIVVSAAVALVIAHLQRKQMRQIELYKQDPANGLIPPPSVLTRFVKSRWDLLLAFGGPVINLAVELSRSSPINRLSVLVVSFSVAVLMANVVMLLIFRQSNRTLDLIGSLTTTTGEAVSGLSEMTRDLFEISKGHTAILEKLAELLGPSAQLLKDTVETIGDQTKGSQQSLPAPKQDQPG